MYDLTVPAYCASLFWGYRLFRQCRRDGSWWFHRLLCPVLGLILLAGPWIIGVGNPLGHGLISIVLLAIVADSMANAESGKAVSQAMPYDEKLLFVGMLVGIAGWAVFQFM